MFLLFTFDHYPYLYFFLPWCRRPSLMTGTTRWMESGRRRL